jgi:adenosylmethionine-8-amino-7-oxononanoate aminotransferase
MFAKSVETAALQHGLIGYACRGTVEGTKGDHMLFAPPLTLTTQEADMLAARLKAAIKDVWEKQ